MKHILLLLCILWCITTITEAAEYNSPNSGIESYWTGTTWIQVKFKNSSKRYKYEESRYGKDTISYMKELAKTGKGLNTYLNDIKNLETYGLILIDNLCGDTWCEGQTDYRFTKLICLDPIQECILYYTIVSADDIETVGTKGSVTIKDIDRTDFYPTEDNWISDEVADKLFKLFD